MKVSKLLTDDEAVSPVIGVILMVAITTILAAVIGGFVLDLGGGLETKTNPNAKFDFSYANGGPGTCTNLGNAGTLDITHQNGDRIDENRLTIRDSDGNTETFDCDSLSDGATVSAGTTVSVGVDKDDTVRVVWTSKNTDPDSQQSATLATWDGPNA